jgi:hypothetical protein
MKVNMPIDVAETTQQANSLNEASAAEMTHQVTGQVSQVCAHWWPCTGCRLIHLHGL